MLKSYSEGLFCLSGCRKGEIAQLVLADKKEEAVRTACRYRDIFGHHFYIELQDNLNLEDRQLCRNLVELADGLGIGYVATNNVHYAQREGHRLQDVLVFIRNRSTLDTSHHLRRPNSEYHLKPAREMADSFRRYPGAVANSVLLQVDDVDAIALGEDVGLHGRVPLMRAVAEMHTAFQQGLHRDNTHIQLSPSRCSSAAFIPVRNRPGGTPAPVGMRVVYAPNPGAGASIT